MLKSITLKNYTTFINETTFDFSATSYKILENTNVGENRILKGCLFVGENASGKTQVLKAIKFLLDLLLTNSEINFSQYRSLFTNNTSFSIKYVFSFDKQDVTYELNLKDDAIDVEKLYVNNNLKIERLGNNGKVYLNGDRSFEDLHHTLSLVKQEYYNTRFDNDIILNKWFKFLKQSIYINCLERSINIYESANMVDIIISTEESVKKINKFFNEIGYTTEVFQDKETKEIKFKKNNTQVALPIKRESLGNQVLYNMAIPLILSLNNDSMLIADEFSSGLHNLLEETLIKYFFKKSKNSQLFFTSHSTNLLDTILLRPDQIYSFQFDSQKGTLIKRFSDEMPRESQNIEKMYLSGVFDGVPKYNQEFENK